MLRFMGEARAAGGLNHPGIVEVVDLDHDGDVHYIAMERLEGEELLARIERESPLPIRFVARIGADIADAISAAHAHTPKIVHRDLKPQNVILARKGPQRDVVKIVDFGIAKLLEAESLEQSLTRSGEIYGTPLYMSPEQLRNSKEVDERTDIYSIGVMLYQALAGVTPFRGESFSSLVVSITSETPAPLRELRPQIPVALAAVVERAMARDKHDRFPSGAALRDALLPFADERAPEPEIVPRMAGTQKLPVVPLPRPVTAPARRRRAPLALVVGLALAGAAGGALLFLDEHRELGVVPAARDAAPEAPVRVVEEPVLPPRRLDTAAPPAPRPPIRPRKRAEPRDELPTLRPR
jgi:serine/threonine-protein kinase